MGRPLLTTLALVLAMGGAASGAGSQEPAKAPKLTFDGDTALWTVAIKPDKTAEFEQVMKRVQEALTKSEDPDRRRQAAGWRVIRLNSPLPDGNVAFVHIVHPVVAGADYTVMQILYDAFPDERQALYDLYRSAFAKNLSLAVGQVAVDAAASPAGAVGSTQ
jgi:hypothetical protein